MSVGNLCLSRCQGCPQLNRLCPLLEVRLLELCDPGVVTPLKDSTLCRAVVLTRGLHTLMNLGQALLLHDNGTILLQAVQQVVDQGLWVLLRPSRHAVLQAASQSSPRKARCPSLLQAAHENVLRILACPLLRGRIVLVNKGAGHFERLSFFDSGLKTHLL